MAKTDRTLHANAWKATNQKIYLTHPVIVLRKAAKSLLTASTALVFSLHLHPPLSISALNVLEIKILYIHEFYKIVVLVRSSISIVETQIVKVNMLLYLYIYTFNNFPFSKKFK